MDINSLDQLIGSVLTDGKKYFCHSCKSLLSAGENYGSCMLDVEIKLEKNGKVETLRCVAKTTPPSEVIWKIFNTSVTFKKEINLYKEVVPTLNEFGKEKGIDNLLPFFAKCYGARISLDSSSNEVDKDAVLLLENLKTRGFGTVDRFKGFNVEETKLLLKDLAIFHAAPIALKLQKPEEFETKIRPHLNRDFHFTPDKAMYEKFFELVKVKASTNPEVAALIPKFEASTMNGIKLLQEPLKPNELYATMVHNDYWVNNTMLRYENGIAVENIMVDFQVLEYNSPATDLVFLLYSSVQVEALDGNIDYFIRYYYDAFIDTLRRLGCDTEPFTYESFMDDLNFTAKNYQFLHTVMMLQPIYTKKEEAKDLSKLQKEEDILAEASSLHDNMEKKLHFILLDFDKRGWL